MALATSGNAVGYLQRQLGGAYDATERARRQVAAEVRERRAIAYALKGVAALGGLILAAGLVPPASQVLGLAITAAVAIDQLFSNHLRLIATVKASQAYGRLLRTVMRTHQRELAPIIVLKSTDEAAAARQLNSLNARLLLEMHTGSELIETALDEADIKALLKLSLEPDNAGGAE